MLPVHLAARAELRAHRVAQANTLRAHRVAQANTLPAHRAHWVARVEQLAGQLIIKVAYHHFDAAGNQLECEGGGAYGFAIYLYAALGLCLNLYAMSLLEEHGR